MDALKTPREEKGVELANGVPPAGRRPSPWRYTLPALALFAVLGVAYWGIRSRHNAQADLVAAARLMNRLPVATVHPRASDASNTLSLPANVQAFVETPIYARTNGYLKRWYADIGGRVRAGQLLAEIETPEIDEELRQAEAAQAQATANLELARKTAERWQNLLKSDGVSQQEVDQNVSAYHARQADLAAAQANVQRLRDMQSFQKVVAPFGGIITARNVDVGALISPTNTQPLFKMADTRTLRVYVNVPQVYSRSMLPGLEASLNIAEFPAHPFAGKVVRTAGAIDPASRTLLTEVQVPNPAGQILPGAYGTVQFHLQLKESPLVLPANVLLFRAQGTQVATVDASGKVHVVNVVLGRDLGTQVEVVSGVKPGDQVIVNPSDSIAEGDGVTVEKDSGTPGSPAQE